MRTANQKNRVAVTYYYTDNKGDQIASFAIFPLKDRTLEYLRENDTPKSGTLQFYTRNPLEVKQGEYTKRDVAHLRELAVDNEATHLIVLEPYNESLGGHKKIADEELNANDQNMSERVRIGVIFEGSRKGYHYSTNYAQEHVFSNLLTERFYRVVMSYEPLRPFDPEPKEAFVKSFMKTGRFYTGILDNNPVFDYLYVANKDGTVELYDRDGDMTVLNPTRTASSVRVASRYLSR